MRQTLALLLLLALLPLSVTQATEITTQQHYDQNGYNNNGFDKYGYNKDGYNKNGYDRQGYDKQGFNKDGYDRQGFNIYGCNKSGYTRDGLNGKKIKNPRGDLLCGENFNNKNGYDDSGFNRVGYDRFGCDEHGFNRAGKPCSKTKQNNQKEKDTTKQNKRKGHNKVGYDQEGYDRSGYNRSSYGSIAQSMSSPASQKTVNTDYRVQQEGNKALSSQDKPVSTFSIDIDSGSYDLYRSEISQETDYEYIKKIDKTIRTEEFINAFNYKYPKPNSIETPFSTHFEVMDSPWSKNKVLKIGIQGYQANLDNLPPVNLVFLVDTSGSMRQELSMMKKMLKNFADKLRPDDSISIVTYAGHTRLYLEGTKAKNKNKIKNSINQLSSSGSTNGESGIIMAYEQATNNYIENGINRVVLMSDGDFNVGQTDASTLEEMIKQKSESGVDFSTVGINIEGHNYNDNAMEKLSNIGNGHYIFIGDMTDVNNFTTDISSSLATIAKDVKIQIEFNPETVKEYRLIGYENRKLDKDDFNNDKVDAGDLMSGSNVTALYEITLEDNKKLIDDLRYQSAEKTPSKDFGDELAYLKLRYKKPEKEKSELLTFPLKKELIGNDTTKDGQFAMTVAGFSQLLRGSDYISESYNFDDVLKAAQTNKGDDKNGKRAEFIDTVKLRKAID